MANKKAYYRKKADRAFQDWFTKENPICEICGNETSCGHHFHTKGASSRLRYEADNIVPVCVGCHLSFHSKRAAEATSILIQKRGLDWANKLLVKKREYIKCDTIGYYREIILKYTNND
jgi:hypothetical protein